eukprot:Seg904.3 transcript_id=Seg904.3/GoldUCD/mRNA.D3Y31 product="Cyclin-D-binding Myb-like transcription factor 1" protein_id=Seg904.3/GoldUCD/D3Y31
MKLKERSFDKEYGSHIVHKHKKKKKKKGKERNEHLGNFDNKESRMKLRDRKCDDRPDLFAEKYLEEDPIFELHLSLDSDLEDGMATDSLKPNEQNRKDEKMVTEENAELFSDGNEPNCYADANKKSKKKKKHHSADDEICEPHEDGSVITISENCNVKSESADLSQIKDCFVAIDPNEVQSLPVYQKSKKSKKKAKKHRRKIHEDLELNKAENVAVSGIKVEECEETVEVISEKDKAIHIRKHKKKKRKESKALEGRIVQQVEGLQKVFPVGSGEPNMNFSGVYTTSVPSSIKIEETAGFLKHTADGNKANVIHQHKKKKKKRCQDLGEGEIPQSGNSTNGDMTRASDNLNEIGKEQMVTSERNENCKKRKHKKKKKQREASDLVISPAADQMLEVEKASQDVADPNVLTNIISLPGGAYYPINIVEVTRKKKKKRKSSSEINELDSDLSSNNKRRKNENYSAEADSCNALPYNCVQLKKERKHKKKKRREKIKEETDREAGLSNEEVVVEQTGADVGILSKGSENAIEMNNAKTKVHRKSKKKKRKHENGKMKVRHAANEDNTGFATSKSSPGQSIKKQGKMQQLGLIPEHDIENDDDQTNFTFPSIHDTDDVSISSESDLQDYIEASINETIKSYKEKSDLGASRNEVHTLIEGCANMNEGSGPAQATFEKREREVSGHLSDASLPLITDNDDDDDGDGDDDNGADSLQARHLAGSVGTKEGGYTKVKKSPAKTQKNRPADNGNSTISSFQAGERKDSGNSKSPKKSSANSQKTKLVDNESSTISSSVDGQGKDSVSKKSPKKSSAKPNVDKSSINDIPTRNRERGANYENNSYVTRDNSNNVSGHLSDASLPLITDSSDDDNDSDSFQARHLAGSVGTKEWDYKKVKKSPVKTQKNRPADNVNSTTSSFQAGERKDSGNSKSPKKSSAKSQQSKVIDIESSAVSSSEDEQGKDSVSKKSPKKSSANPQQSKPIDNESSAVSSSEDEQGKDSVSKKSPKKSSANPQQSKPIDNESSAVSSSEDEQGKDSVSKKSPKKSSAKPNVDKSSTNNIPAMNRERGANYKNNTYVTRDNSNNVSGHLSDASLPLITDSSDDDNDSDSFQARHMAGSVGTKEGSYTKVKKSPAKTQKNRPADNGNSTISSFQAGEGNDSGNCKSPKKSAKSQQRIDNESPTISSSEDEQGKDSVSKKSPRKAYPQPNMDKSSRNDIPTRNREKEANYRNSSNVTRGNSIKVVNGIEDHRPKRAGKGDKVMDKNVVRQNSCDAGNKTKDRTTNVSDSDGLSSENSGMNDEMQNQHEENSINNKKQKKGAARGKTSVAKDSNVVLDMAALMSSDSDSGLEELLEDQRMKRDKNPDQRVREFSFIKDAKHRRRLVEKQNKSLTAKENRIFENSNLYLTRDKLDNKSNQSTKLDENARPSKRKLESKVDTVKSKSNGSKRAKTVDSKQKGIDHELRLKWILDPEDLAQLKNEGIQFETGVWTNNEVEILEGNMKDACKSLKMSIADMKKLLADRSMDARQRRTELGVYPILARGLNRTMRSVFERLKTSINPDNYKGEWTFQEEKRVLELYRKYGNQWLKIGEEIGRSQTSVSHKVRRILGGDVRKGIDKMTEISAFGPWKRDEEDRLLKALKDLAKKTKDKDKGKKEKTPIQWIPVAVQVKTRNAEQCRVKWEYDLCWKKPGEISKKWTGNDFAKLLTLVSECGETHEKNVDWVKIKKELGKPESAVVVKKKWLNMKRKVPGFKLLDFKDHNKWLMQNKVPRMLGDKTVEI